MAATETLYLPNGWHALTPEQAALALRLLSQHDGAEVRLRFVLALYGLKRGRTIGGDPVIYKLLNDGRKGRVSLEEISHAIDALDWLFEPWPQPIALPPIAQCAPLAPELHGLAFGDWLAIDNYYQGYLHTHHEDALEHIVRLLWPDLAHTDLVPTRAECLGALLWVECIKRVFAEHFPDFLRPIDEPLPDPHHDMTHAMNAQIRALTGGDVCKEEQVLAIDVWRAMTELNEKAREAKAMQRAAKP